MLRHTSTSAPGEKVLVIGASGFIGRALTEKLNSAGFSVEGISSAQADLTSPQSVDVLKGKISECDALIMLSCLTPDKGRGAEVFLKNILMGKHVCDAIKLSERAPHVVYFSSDAVYSFSDALVSEATPAVPTDLYGVMHRARELMFAEICGEKLAIIRPTLVYGAGDTHNSYGPNRLRREAFKNGTITLFGEGEDTRAHISVSDLAELTLRVILSKSVGVLNAAPDKSVTYKELAQHVAALFGEKISIQSKPRAAEPNHRFFDTSVCYAAFPGFVFMGLEEGVKRDVETMKQKQDVNI